MAIRLKEIADLVGVSESTVSRALNNSLLISDKTRQKVLEAARKLNYQSGRMNLIGVIQPKITNPLYGEVIEAIEAHAYQAGYGLVLCESTFSLDRERAQLDFLLRQGGIQGVILVPIDPEARHVRQLTEHILPCVILGTAPTMGLDQVNVDAVMGAYVATRHLLDLGHRCIGMVQGPDHVAACQERLKGYRRALADFDVPFNPDLVTVGEVDETGGAEAMGKLLNRVVPGQNHTKALDFTAVFAISDTMAMGALRRLRESGRRVPEEISLAGCDDIPIAAQLQPALTTVWQPKHELGALATDLLLKQIATRDASGNDWKQTYTFQSTMFFPHLVVRESTCAPGKAY